MPEGISGTLSGLAAAYFNPLLTRQAIRPCSNRGRNIVYCLSRGRTREGPAESEKIMKKYRLITALLLGAVLCFSACGGKETAAPQEGAAQEEAAAGEEEETEEAEEAADAEDLTEEAAEEEDLFPELAEFTVHDIYGNEVDQTIFEGKELTMVNIWGTFCPPCKMEMPDLGKLNREYDPDRFQVVGIVCDLITEDLTLDPDLVEEAKAIADETGADYTHLALEGDLIPMLFRFDSVPTTVFVDAEGNQVGTYYVGARSEEDWRAVIDSLLEGDA